jgi:ABC-2 type transport system permease protein
MRLLAVEVRRFWARRAIAVVLLVTVAAAALLAGSQVWSTRVATEAEVTAAQQQLAAESASTREDYQACLDDPTQPAQGPAERRCEELDPQLEWFLPRPALDLGDQLGGSGLALALILAGAAIVVGTTFAGADWHSGSLSTQLLFQPRRLRVWVAKAAAVVLGAAVSAAVVTAAYWLTLGGVAQARGLDIGAGLVSDIAMQGARSVLLSAAAGLGAFAFTMALRSTMATLALLFAYTVAGEALWASLSFTKASQWSLAANVQAWVLDGLRVYDESICRRGDSSCDPTYVLTAAHGAAYLGVLLLVAVGLSLLLFPRRDVS